MDGFASERDDGGGSTGTEEGAAAPDSSHGPHPQEAGSPGLAARRGHPDRVPLSPFSGTDGRSAGRASEGPGPGLERTPPLDLSGLRLPPLSIVTSGAGQGKALRPDHAGSSALTSTSVSISHRTMSSSLYLSPSTLKASMATQTRVERNFRKAKNMVNRELVAFLTETTNAASRLERALPDEQLWHVEHALGIAQRCIQEPLERFKESVKDEVDQLEELRRDLDGDSAFCKRMYAKLLFVLSHCSRLMATQDEYSPGVAGTPACFKAARTKRERRSSVKGKRGGEGERIGSGGKGGVSLRSGVSGLGRSGVSSSISKQPQHCGSALEACARPGMHKSGSGTHVRSQSTGSSPRGVSPSRSPGRSPTCTPVIRQLQELHLAGSGDSNPHRDLGIPEIPIPVRTTLANALHQQTPSTPPSGSGLPRYAFNWKANP